MGEFPKDGSTFVVESIDRTAYRWAKYKPDGARQMGKPGRWQKQVWHGDWFKWENCEEPEGEISLPIEDGPITKAFKGFDTLEAEKRERSEYLVGVIEERERLRRAGIAMQIAVAKVLECGGTSPGGWFDALAEAQRNLSGATKASRDEFDKARAALEPKP